MKNMNKWIDVREELPHSNKNGDSEDVLVILRKFGFNQSRISTDTYIIASYSSTYNTWETEDNENIEANADYMQVVYWQPLPAKPLK